MNPSTRCLALLPIALIVLFGGENIWAEDAEPGRPQSLPPLIEIRVTSTRDGSGQPSLLAAPSANGDERLPLLVFLHSWSYDYRQQNDDWRREAAERGWIYLHPNFRGRNDRPEACGSALARQDVLDAIEFVAARHPVDRSRIYLAGTSGGGHMAMLMAGYHPQRFSAVSAWVGISDLAEWHRFHARDGKPDQYAEMIVRCCGGVPGASEKVDAEYRSRSPLFHLGNAKDVPLDLSAGVNDGHTGSVPIGHTLRAFNVVARAGGHEPIPDEEIHSLERDRKPSDAEKDRARADAEYGRDIVFRRQAGDCRVTIFNGGHEGLPQAACAWLARQKRDTAEVVP